MTDEKRFLLLNIYKKHLNSPALAVVSEYQKKIDDDSYEHLLKVKLKDPIIGIVLAWFLGAFGAGAFYVKKIGYGVVQLLLYILYFISLFGYLFEGLSNDFGVYTIIFACLLLAFLVTFFVSVFSIVKWIKEYNYKKLMEILPLL